MILITLMSTAMKILNLNGAAAGHITSSPFTDDFLNYFILIALLAIGLFLLFIFARKNRKR